MRAGGVVTIRERLILKNKKDGGVGFGRCRQGLALD